MKNWLIFTLVCFYLPPDTYARVGHTNDKSTAQSTALIETNPSAQRRKVSHMVKRLHTNRESFFYFFLISSIFLHAACLELCAHTTSRQK